jgi:hypothetical protein
MTLSRQLHISPYNHNNAHQRSLGMCRHYPPAPAVLSGETLDSKTRNSKEG